MTRRFAVLAVASALAACVVLVPGPAASADEVPASDAATFKNVKILTNVTSKTEMRRIMKEQSAALGVKCSHCHVPGKFELDDKKEKLVAREMMKMVANLNATSFKDFATKPALTCWSCHRGATDVETAIPQAAFDKVDAAQ